MRSVDSWLDEYGESHQNPTNKQIHWICVPLIVWTVTALLWAIPSPVAWLNWAVLLTGLAMVWYVALSPRLAIGIGLFLALCLGLNAWLAANVAMPLWQIALIVFIAAWIGQFVGHHIEGKRPSFFKDLQFLLVGPAWLMGFVYRKFGWRYG
ncbi:MAG: Mpo1-like protein [Wenzhouxiangellaceae bacterium]|nr:Mpo1-like protein [Wenzhouxiangellaceae bacterium]